MNGTEKQVEFAKEIIEKRMAVITSINEGRLSKSWWATNHVSGDVPDFNFDKVCEFLHSMTDAASIIESRNEKTADLYAKHIGFKYTEQNNDYDESDPFAL